VGHGAGGRGAGETRGRWDVAARSAGGVERITIAPSDVGAPVADLADLKGGDADANAAKIRALFAGETGPYRDIVLFNAAAALVAYGEAPDLMTGAARAAAALDDGAAQAALDSLVAITTGSA